MHWAALYGQENVGQLLVDGNPDTLDSQTKSGETALHLSAEKGNLEFVRFLLAAKANPEIRDRGAGGGATAYDSAREKKHKEIMVLLKPKGAGGCCVIS